MDSQVQSQPNIQEIEGTTISKGTAVVIGDLQSLSRASQDVVQGLCEACSTFNISHGSFLADSWNEQRAHQLGSYQAIASRKSCPLCQLIAEAYRDGPVGFHSQGFVAKSTLGSLHVHGAWQKVPFDGEGAVINLSIHEEYEAGGTPLSLQPLDCAGPGDKHPNHFARELGGPSIDIEMVREWLRGCEEDHQCCRLIPIDNLSIDYERPAAFRCIDVHELGIVYPPSRCRYITLSYQWGSGPRYIALRGNIDTISNSNGLLLCWDELSLTIKDAISLTRLLGERYLWVDSLCIVQDGDPIEKQRVLEDMRLVYSQALLMICAADDSCIKNGLGGLNHPRSQKQYFGTLAPDLTLAAVFYAPAYLELSSYRSRGWTFQEEILGQRALIFIHDQVYFKCSRGTYTEELNAKPSTTLQVPKSAAVVEGMRSESQGLPFMNYFDAVQEYTARSLTYPSDILNAFQGVLRELVRAMNCEAFAGLPTAMFDMALLWQPSQRLARRDGFPSWSWAGWHGSVVWRGDTMNSRSYFSDTATDMDYEKETQWIQTQTWVIWHRYTGIDGRSVIPVWSPSATNSTTTSPSQVGYNFKESSNLNPFGRKVVEGIKPPPHILPNPPPEVPNIDSTLLQSILQFMTLSVKFRIRSSSAYLRYGSVDPPWEPKGRMVFLLINRNNAVCGYVLLNDTWESMPANDSTAKTDTNFESDPKEHTLEPLPLHEFILLSKANYNCQWGRPHAAHPYTNSYELETYIEFHAMMLTWKGGVAERVGLGRIHQEALVDAWEGPEWKDILLS